MKITRFQMQIDITFADLISKICVLLQYYSFQECPNICPYTYVRYTYIACGKAIRYHARPPMLHGQIGSDTYTRLDCSYNTAAIGGMT